MPGGGGLFFAADQGSEPNGQGKAQEHQPEPATNPKICHLLKGNNKSRLVKFKLGVDNTGIRSSFLPRFVRAPKCFYAKIPEQFPLVR